ncbi:phospholipase/Carboxylesterase [Hirsutella rhossiliensis]|uniref:Phospholipase/Carboxylesterase domain-containing protein n=1 Tax=Hirsutella rhossiliensis TaxID=111463 RepID=A0A9P8SKK7_9HYPO|nr:phospholipase/Carboxylesterase domain-containing protein [Hirsutella rhossiliensis]KAH0964236.1 phospholipase/Carboxylesterase domain-containing protein [Hirsutella rhossiliensis]
MATPACNRDPHLSGEQPAYVVKPSARHTHTVILLHDVASSGNMFGRDLLRAGRTSSGKTLDHLFPGVRFVFPTAQRRPCCALGQLKVGLWFDMARFQEPSFRQDLQRESLCVSARQIVVLLRWEMRLVPATNILIGGLGQGCAMSLVVLLSLGFRLGGVIGMSGYLPFQFELQMNTAEDSSTDDDDDDDDYDDEDDDDDYYDDDDDDDEEYEDDDGRENGSNGALEPQDPVVRAQIFERTLLQIKNADSPTKEKTSCGTPIFLGHGADDTAVPCELGEQAAGAMRSVEYQVEWRCYPGLGHGYHVPGEMDDIVDFVRSKVGLEPRA